MTIFLRLNDTTGNVDHQPGKLGKAAAAIAQQLIYGMALVGLHF